MTGGRVLAVALVGVALGLTGVRGAPAADELRCRCAPRDLGEYFDDADEVVLGRLVSFEESDTHRVFRMVLEAEPWKPAEARGAQRRLRGDTVEYTTPVSTATCGVPPDVGALFVVFGRVSRPGSPRSIDTCTGTRVYRGPGEEGPHGFRDVPGRFVLRQLDALGGLAALEGLSPLPAHEDTSAAVLRGLLDLAPLWHGGRVVLRARPDPTSPVVVSVESHGKIRTREVDYELPAAVVVGRVDSWSRLVLDDGRSGWVSPEASGTWFPFAELPIRRLAYLTPAWSGYLWPAAGAGIPSRPQPSGGPEGDHPVEALESRRIGDLPWFRVRLLRDSPCEAGPEAGILAEGWIPGYGHALPGRGGDLEPTVWFWSRGC